MSSRLPLWTALALSLGTALPANAPAADVGQCFSTPDLNAAMKAEGQRAMAQANKIAPAASRKPSARIGVTFTSDPTGKVGYVLNSDDAIGQKISRTCIVQKLRDVAIYDTEEPGVPAAALVKGERAEALATCKRLPIEDGATCGFHNEALATLKTIRESALLQGRNERGQLVTVTARLPGDGRGAMSISTPTGAYILLTPLVDTSYTDDARALLKKAPAK